MFTTNCFTYHLLANTVFFASSASLCLYISLWVSFLLFLPLSTFFSFLSLSLSHSFKTLSLLLCHSIFLSHSLSLSFSVLHAQTNIFAFRSIKFYDLSSSIFLSFFHCFSIITTTNFCYLNQILPPPLSLSLSLSLFLYLSPSFFCAHSFTIPESHKTYD